MATRKSQRIAIWAIAIAMLVGTVGGFAVLMIDPGGEMQRELAYERQLAEWEEQMEEEARQRAEANRPLEGYEATPFEAGDVTELKVEVLEEGDGAVLDEDSTISANYFGWTSDGEIFDSTNQNGEVNPAQFGLNQVISGWTQGLSGVKVGSTVKLTIPSSMAYGDDESTGGPTGPLVFIVEVVEKVEEVSS